MPAASLSVPAKVITVNLNTAIDRVLEVPELALGAHLKGRQLSRHPAGKAINVSRGLGRLGRSSVATGFVGGEQLQQFERFLAEQGPGRVVCQLLSVRGCTRENITLIDPVNHTDTHIRDQGFEVQENDVARMLSKLGLLARPDTVIVFSGSIPNGLELSDLNLLVTVAMTGGAKVVLDLGGDLLAAMRLLEGEEGEAEPLPDMGKESGGLWLVKPNREELAQTLGMATIPDDRTLLEAARRLAQRVRWVVVTEGAQGAWLIDGKQGWRGKLAIEQEKVINTVGCGDCMNAGLIDGFLAGLAPAEVLRHGLAVATANALHFGIAEFDLEQVRELEKRVQIEPVTLGSGDDRA